MTNLTKHHTGTGHHDDTGLRALCGHRLGAGDHHIGVWSLDRYPYGDEACGDCLAILTPPRHRRDLHSLEDGNAIADLRAKLMGYAGGKHSRGVAA
jgi:hypothetical protein